MVSKTRRWARREWRAFKREMTPGRVLMRLLFGHPRNHPSLRRLTRPTTVASIRRDAGTGKLKTRGVRLGPDGWVATAGRKPASAETKRQRQTPKQRRDQRAAARPGRPAGGGNQRLARDYQQRADGRMAGSSPARNGLPTPRQATGLTRLGCDWCRSSGMRPIYTGIGIIKTVIAVQRCNHRWSSRDGGPSQQPPDRTDVLLCQPCANTGLVLVETVGRGGGKSAAQVPCHTCQGWIMHW